jgi:hypothetical protein
MVHGTYYGIQYEIYLTKQIDFYNILLPIWMEVRSRIEMEKNNNGYKLIVIPYRDFNSQLLKNSLFISYIKENNYSSYTKATQTEDYLRSNKLAIVRQYEKIIRHKTDLPEPITKEEFKKISDEMQELKQISLFDRNMSQEESSEFSRKYDEIFNQLQIQRIIHDPEYFEEIKDLHAKILEQVNFDDEQRELIQKVIFHPNLKGIISWHGLSLVDGFL